MSGLDDLLGGLAKGAGGSGGSGLEDMHGGPLRCSRRGIGGRGGRRPREGPAAGRQRREPERPVPSSDEPDLLVSKFGG